MIKIFILHHNKLIDRKIFLLNSLSKYNLDIEWVENFTPDAIKEKYDEYLEGWENFENVYIKVINNHSYNNFSKKMSINELSLYMKHEFALKRQIESNYEMILILEDDCLIPGNFDLYLNKILNEYENVKEEVDVLMIGSAFDFVAKDISKDKLIYTNSLYLTRCTHAIAYNIRATKKILNKILPRNLPFDFKLNEIFTLEKINVGWIEPGLVQNNYFKSSLTR